MTIRRVVGLSICAVIALLLAGFQVLRAQPEEQLDSLVVCKDTQKLIFENMFVRVIDNRAPAGNAEKKHKHARGVTVALTDYDTETVSYPDKTASRRHTNFGEVRWAEPTVHEVKNVGTTEQHVIRIELK